jgi:excisionase family DNA binding protein
VIEKLFSPKQVARALGVSESSLKRWCDRGLIETRRTGGGHRRIPLDEVCRFLRDSEQFLVRPELLGLPATSGQCERGIKRAQDNLLQAIRRGDEQASRDIVMDLYLAGFEVSRICDELLTVVMHRVGDLWQCGEIEVYEERLGCEIYRRILEDFRRVLPPPSQGAPLAIGAAPEGDPYSLANRMVELVLCEAGWQATALGGALPFDTLTTAAQKRRPRLFWLSVSAIPSSEQFLRQYAEFHAALPEDVALVAGGRALNDSIRSRMVDCVHCNNLTELKHYVQTLWKSET